jgi:phosphate uptake regulator
MPGPLLSREIIGSYLLGFDIISVESKQRISFEAREIVKTAAGRLVGLEIVEEDYSRIVMQCLLEPSRFTPEKILRRGYTIAAGMHRDAITALVDEDEHLAKSVAARDDEVNRFHFLLVRILRTIIQNPGLSEKLGVRPIECLDYRLAASLVETIGDQCVRIAMKTAELKGASLSDDLKKTLMEFHLFCFESHENAVKAFTTGNIALAESVRATRGRAGKLFSEIESIAKMQARDLMPHILAVASFLRQIYEDSIDIADLVMPRKEQSCRLTKEA